MLGWKVTRSIARGRWLGREVQTMCGAGNSSVLVDEADGVRARVARAAALGERRDQDERDDVDDDDAADEQEPARRQPRRRGRGCWAGVSATASVATGSLDTVPPHTGARRSAALGLVRQASWVGYSIVLRNLLTSR